MGNFILSILLGAIPEVLYFTWFISKFKNIKENRFKIYVLYLIGYIALIMTIRYQYVLYVLFIAYMYVILMLFTKTKIIDVFIITIAYCYLTITSATCCILIHNYAIAYIIHRILLFFIFTFKSKFNKFYKIYYNLWDRHENSSIKSITLRNISIVFLNATIILLNFVILRLLKMI